MSTLKPHKEILLDQIFAASDYEIPYDMLWVGNVRPNDNPDMVGDTAVTVTSLNPKRWVGSVESTFDKIDLEWLFATYLGIEHLTLNTRATTVHDLIPALQINYSMNVDKVDLLDDPIEWDEDEATVIVRAAPESMFYKGELLAFVIKPQLIPLSEIITTINLGGLNYPTA